MDKYEETKAILGAMADVKMKMNAHKGEIEDVYVGDLIDYMGNEVQELVKAVDGQDILHILEEAADIMNYLVAVAHNQIKQYRSRK